MDAVSGMDRMEEEFIDAAGELIRFLKENGRASEAASVFAMAAYVKEMETKLDQVLLELTDVKGQLKDMQEYEESETLSLSQYLSETTEQMAEDYRELKNQLTAIKGEMKDKSKEIVTAVKQKGRKELGRISELLQIGEQLERFREKTQKALTRVEETIDKIETFGKHMRSAGRETANAMRALAGKEEKDYGDKKTSKTELLKKPFLIKKKLLKDILRCTEKAIGVCDRISHPADKEKNMDETEETLSEPEEVSNEKTNVNNETDEKSEGAIGTDEKSEDVQNEIGGNEKLVEYQKKRKGR